MIYYSLNTTIKGGLNLKIVLDIPEIIYSKADDLVKENKYSSLSLFAKVAFENQLCLEEAESEGVRNIPLKENLQRAVSSSLLTSALSDLRLKQGNHFAGKILPLPDFPLISDVPPEHSMIWGQINKVFPVKFILRYFVSQFNNGDTVRIETFRDTVVKAARGLGAVLLSYDNEKGTRRDERLSIAFPLGDTPNDCLKADSRFGNQYVGYVRKDGKLSGALFEMRFAAIKNENDKFFISVTQSGLAFAQLSNPILDNNAKNKTISEEEARFYVEHCKQNLSGEYSAMCKLASLISEGTTSRVELTNSFKQFIDDSQQWRNTQKLESYANTQRSGLISKMYEMKLLDKKRDVNKVQYLITALGQELLLNS